MLSAACSRFYESVTPGVSDEKQVPVNACDQTWWIPASTSSREASQLLSQAFFFFLGGAGRRGICGLTEDILLRSILIARERERNLSLMQPNPCAFKSC